MSNPSPWNRNQPIQQNQDAYGMGAFGIGLYSVIDPTRYAWTRTKAIFTSILLCLFLAARAEADSLTPTLGLTLPSVGVVDATNCNATVKTGCYGTKLNNNFTLIDQVFTATFTVVANPPILGKGLASNPLSLDVSSVTLQGNVFNGASQLIKFDPSKNYPTGTLAPTNVGNGNLNPGVLISTANASVLNAAGGLVGLDANNKLPAADGSQLTNLPAPTSLIPSWQGINYLVWYSSGPTIIADSTATFSFNVEASSVVFRGKLFALAKQNFSVVASTYTLISWNSTNGYRQFGLKDFMPPTISSATAGIADDLVLSLSSTDVNGITYPFESVWASPLPGFFFSGTGSTAFTNLTGGQIAPFYDCKVHPPYSLPSCDTNRLHATFTGPGGFGTWGFQISQADVNGKWCAVVNNASGSSANIVLYEPSGGGSETWITVDGVQPGTVNNASRTPKNVAVGAGYHPVCLYLDVTAGATYSFEMNFPLNVYMVRGGEW